MERFATPTCTPTVAARTLRQFAYPTLGICPVHSDVRLGVCVPSDPYDPPLMSSCGDGISLEGGLCQLYGLYTPPSSY